MTLDSFSVRWLDSDTTRITYAKNFESQDWILKADILSDAITMLTEKYNQVLKDAGVDSSILEVLNHEEIK
jgi:hypothetical protein